jgi:methyl-accepting chemotaxis protein
VFAAPVTDENNDVNIIIAGIISLSQDNLFSHLYQTKIGETGGFLVFSPEDKIFIASNIPEMVLQPTPKEGINLLHDKVMKGFRGVGVTINAKSVKELTAISSVENTGWVVVVRIPVEEAYLPLKHLSRTLIVSQIVLFLAISTFIVLILLYILNPLKKASLAVRAMASGEREINKLPVKQNDEVGYLLDGLNNFVETIELRTKELVTANDELVKQIDKIEELSGLLPICAKCKKIRDDNGYWNLLESYIEQHSNALFSHSLCPDCSEELYGQEEWYKKMKSKKKD